MARATSKTKSSTAKSPAAISTTPVMPSDDPNPTTTSSAASQETSIPAQATAPNSTKKTKALAGSKNASLDHAALLARLAEKEGEYIFSRKHIICS